MRSMRVGMRVGRAAVAGAVVLHASYWLERRICASIVKWIVLCMRALMFGYTARSLYAFDNKMNA